MAEQVVIDLEKPENLKDSFKLNLSDAVDQKAGVSMTLIDDIKTKDGKQVNVQSEDNPKTW